MYGTRPEASVDVFLTFDFVRIWIQALTDISCVQRLMVSLYISHKCALYQPVLLPVCRTIFYSMHWIPFRSPCFVYMAPKQRTRRLVLAPCESGATLSVKVVYSNTNYNLIMHSIIFLPFFLCELYWQPSPTLSSTKYTYMNIILLFVNHAVFTMFQFLCLDNGNNVAARRLGHFDVSMTTNIESMIACFIPIPANKDTR